MEGASGGGPELHLRVSNRGPERVNSGLDRHEHKQDASGEREQVQDPAGLEIRRPDLVVCC